MAEQEGMMVVIHRGMEQQAKHLEWLLIEFTKASNHHDVDEMAYLDGCIQRSCESILFWNKLAQHEIKSQGKCYE